MDDLWSHKSSKCGWFFHVVKCRPFGWLCRAEKWMKSSKFGRFVGIFSKITIYCEHGMCYGFEVLQTCQSPKHPYQIFKSDSLADFPLIIFVTSMCTLNRESRFFSAHSIYRMQLVIQQPLPTSANFCQLWAVCVAVIAHTWGSLQKPEVSFKWLLWLQSSWRDSG